MSDTKRPKEFTEFNETIMSNSDNHIDMVVAEYIKNKPLFSQYSGWNFCGYVWFDGGNWCCEVWVFGFWRETFIEETLEKIMMKVSNKYGHD